MGIRSVGFLLKKTKHRGSLKKGTLLILDHPQVIPYCLLRSCRTCGGTKGQPLSLGACENKREVDVPKA